MATSVLLPVQRGIIAALKADAGVTALIPAARLYQPETPPTPTWPFGRYGTATETPLLASCLDGSTIRTTYHGFARGPGNDKASQILAAFVAALAGPDGRGRTLDLGGGVVGHVEVTGQRVLPDPAEASAWHAVVDLEVTVAA